MGQTKRATPRTKATIEVKGGPVIFLRNELNQCKGRWALLTEMANGAFSYKWLVAFADGRIKDPGYSKVETLGRLLGLVLESHVGPHALRPRG